MVNLFYLSTKSLILGKKKTSGFAKDIKQLSNFHPLVVVGHGSETQLQVGENANKFTQQEKSTDSEGWKEQ